MKSKMFNFLSFETPLRNVLSFVMAAIFITAGAIKLSDPSAFTQDILRYRMLTEWWSTLLGASLPWLEIMIGIALFVRPLRLSASFLIVGLMIVFNLAVAIALARGLDISCGCFGKTFQEYAGSGLHFLLRDMILLAVSCILLWLQFRTDHSLSVPNCIKQSNPLQTE